MKRVTSHLLTKDRDSLILGRGNDVGQYVNTNAINKLQSVAWSLNENIFHLIHDELKPSEEPLSAVEEAERVRAFKLRDKETSAIMNYLLDNDNRFFFGWKYDSRGRSYSQGYHINPQGNEYRKAMLSFADKEMLTEEGKTYLLIDIANCYGYDKEIWFKRIVEAKKMVKDIFADGRSTDRKIKEYMQDADSPMLFAKAIYAWKEGVIEGKPIGHNMGLDGTASGLQFMSAMSGCVTTAQNSNVHAKIHREYTEEAQARLEELEAELASLN